MFCINPIHYEKVLSNNYDAGNDGCSTEFYICSKDDDNGSETSPLSGDWENIKTEYYSDDGQYEVEEGYGAYYTFTATTMTVHDKEDIFNGKTLNYSIEGNTFRLEGVGISQILERTSTTLKFRSEIVYGYSIMTLKKK
jgi:hypothetical protein